jgi:hypothetical protein
MMAIARQMTMNRIPTKPVFQSFVVARRWLSAQVGRVIRR